MEFSIDKKDLLKNLQLLSKAVPSRSTLPIISSALFTVNNNELNLRATDLEISLNIKCNITSVSDGSIAIPLSKLLEITNAMPSGNLNFNISDIGKVNIKSVSGNYTIMGQPADEFPKEQTIENSSSLNIQSSDLKDIIISTSYAASKDDLKPVLQGVLFQIKNNELVAVATDGHRLVKLEKKQLDTLNFSGNVVIPIKFLTLLLTQLIEDENVIMLIGENHIQVQINNIIITSRTINDSYPDYEGVIPKDNTKTLIIDKNIFYEAIKRVSIFSNKTSKQVSLELNESSIIIKTEDPENITTGKEMLDCNYDGESMTIGYNALYLKEVLQQQGSEEIKIMLKSPLNAGLFIPMDQQENNTKTTLLMPIRLND